MCGKRILGAVVFSLLLLSIEANHKILAKLMNKLFQERKYKRYIQPSMPVKVGLVLQLEGIKEIDDVHETLVSRVRTNMWWYDIKLKCNQSEYQRLHSVMAPQDRVWKPDIAVLNGVAEVETIGNSYTPVQLFHKNGEVQWSPVNIFETKCHIDLEYYPYDTQTCEIHIGAIASPRNHISYSTMQCKESEQTLETSTWRLVKIEKEVRETVIEKLTDKRQDVLVCIYYLRRKSSFYFTNILLPLLFLGIMNPLAFLIPYDSGERISFSMTLFLTFAVFVTIMMEKVPVNSDETSFLQIYLICQLAITGFILIFTTIRIRLLTRSKSHNLNAEAPENALKSISENVKVWEKPVNVDKLDDLNESRKKRRVIVLLSRSLKFIGKGIATRVDICAFFTVFIMQIASNVWFYASVTSGSQI